MDSPVLLTVLGVAVVLLFVFFTGLCLNCKGNSQPTYIRQQHDPRNSYPTNQTFTVVRSYVEPASFTVVPVQPSQHQLITSPSMPDARRISACPSSDGGSQSDYINQNMDNDAVSYEEPPEKTPDPDYLDVLPDDQNASQPNLTSSLNSGQSYQNIKNDDNDDDSDSQHYINVNEDRGAVNETPGLNGRRCDSVGSFGSCSSDGQGSSDYVNAPTHNHVNFHLG